MNSSVETGESEALTTKLQEKNSISSPPLKEGILYTLYYINFGVLATYSLCKWSYVPHNLFDLFQS